MTRILSAIRRRIGITVQPRRRFNCQDQDGAMWHERAQEAAGLLGRSLDCDVDGLSNLDVGDFGCGKEGLRAVLERTLECSFRYQGYDLHPQSMSVVPLDLEQEVPERHFDIIFSLGLLEYMSDVGSLAKSLQLICDRLVVSYVVVDTAPGAPRASRTRLGWRNHHTRAEIETFFTAAGFALGESAVINGGRTILWLWTQSSMSRTCNDRRALTGRAR
jgi:hypothetical protein